MRTRLNRQPTRLKQVLKRWKLIISVILFVSVFVYIVALGTIQFAKQLFSFKAYAPTHKVYAQEKEPTPTPTPTEKEQIEAYIKEVFGEDADKAFLVTGCENKALNPNAVNTAGNFPIGSRDIGVFQINEYWQRTQGKFLFNWKVNVEIAHQLFEENGKSFHLWTCGRKLGV